MNTKEESGPIDSQHLTTGATNANNNSSQSLDTPSPKYAWLKVFGGFLVFFNIWGIPISFGAFQSFYSLVFLPDQSSSAISWIGTTQGALLIITGIFAGPLYDHGYYRALLFTGSFLTVFGIMMLSISTSYYQVFLSQGICTGLGCGLLYVPTLSLIGATFKSGRTTAMSIVTSGVALGGVIYTIVFLKLLPQIQFPWTIRTIGFISLVTFCIAIPALLLPRTPSLVVLFVEGAAKRRLKFDRTVFTDLPFLTFATAQFFIFLGYLVPLFYIPTFAQVALNTSESLARYLLVACQAASLIGRLSTALPASYFGVMPLWVLSCAASGILCFTWMAVSSLGGLIAFSLLYGFFTGALISLPPSIFPLLCPDPNTLGTRMGISWTSTGIAFLVGSPIAGAIIDLENVNFVGVQAWSGAMLLVGTVLLILLWVMIVLKKRKQGQQQQQQQ